MAAELWSLVVLISGAAVGGVVTHLVARAKARSDDEAECRTAARLVYAELIRNSAPVRYFVGGRGLPAHSMVHTAWDSHGEAMARVGRADDFYLIYNGYAALEAIAFLAGDANHIERFGDAVLPSAIDDLVRAIEAAAGLARLSPIQLRKEVDALRLHEQRPTTGVSPTTTGIIAGVPSYALVRIGAAPDKAQSATGGRGRPEEGGVPRPAARLRIYHADHSTDLSDLRLVRSSGEPPIGDSAADETYEGIEATHRFYWEVLQRDSLDGQGMPIEAVVHFGDSYANVFWNGSRLVMGDGDGKLFGRLSMSTEIIAHELTHAVIQYTKALIYNGQSGSLNESISDVFGVLVHQYVRGETAEEAKWLIGAEVFAPGAPQASALRSLASPGNAFDIADLGTDRQVAHMRDYVDAPGDPETLFINMGIPNHAFYNVAMALGGPAWERAGRIWYDTLSDRYLRVSSGFQAFANATARSARARYGASSDELEAVIDGWGEVGVKVQLRQLDGG